MSPQRVRMMQAMTLGGLAQATQAAYAQMVRKLAAHYRRAPDQLSEEEVRAYLLGLRERGVARGTCKISHFGLPFFYDRTLGRDWRLFAEKKIALLRQKRLPNALTEGQVRRLLGAVRNPVHKTCLATLYARSLRISEAASLEVTSVDRTNQTLRIIGKGNKERLAPLPQPVLDDLGRLWRTHRNGRWLFPNRAGDAPLDNRVLSRSFAAAAAAAGIPGRVTPRALRHSFATRLFENGVDIRVVQVLRERCGEATLLCRPGM